MKSMKVKFYTRAGNEYFENLCIINLPIFIIATIYYSIKMWAWLIFVSRDVLEATFLGTCLHFRPSFLYISFRQHFSKVFPKSRLKSVCVHYLAKIVNITWLSRCLRLFCENHSPISPFSIEYIMTRNFIYQKLAFTTDTDTHTHTHTHTYAYAHTHTRVLPWILHTPTQTSLRAYFYKLNGRYLLNQKKLQKSGTDTDIKLNLVFLL